MAEIGPSVRFGISSLLVLNGAKKSTESPREPAVVEDFQGSEGGQWSYDHAHQQLVQGDPDEDRLHVQYSALIVLVGHGHVLHCIILYTISNIPMICQSKIRITQKKEYNHVHNHSY